MKPRSYLSTLFPYFVAIPLAVSLLVIGGSFFFFSQINSHFIIKKDSYTKWEKATEDMKTYALNADKVKQGMAYFKQISAGEMAAVQSFLDANSGDSKGVRIQSVSASTQSNAARDYESPSSSIVIVGHTGDVFSLLVNLQNRYPNVEFSQMTVAPDAGNPGLVQLSGNLSLIKLQ